MKLAESVYALALYAYPREFRRRFAREMRQVFRARLTTAPNVPRFLAAAARDWIVSVLKERFAIMHPRLVQAGIAAGLLFFVTTTIAQAYVIPTGSMEPTLVIGDHLIVNKMAAVPQRDSLIVFRHLNPSQTFIKRVIGLPGDRIRIENKLVIRNGELLNEPYAQHATDYVDAYRDNFPSGPRVGMDQPAVEMLSNHVRNGEVVVPPASLFVLGDNRDRSLDSRFFGFIPEENVIGRPWFVYFSYDAEAQAVRWGRTLFQP